jgi:hypothetical protein
LKNGDESVTGDEGEVTSDEGTGRKRFSLLPGIQPNHGDLPTSPIAGSVSTSKQLDTPLYSRIIFDIFRYDFLLLNTLLIFRA